MEVIHASFSLVLLFLLYNPRELLDIFTLTDDARLAATAATGARAVSAEGGEGLIVLAGQLTGRCEDTTLLPF
jgi:hypothetical protein